MKTDIKNIFRWPVLINAVLFQLTWLACVAGSAKLWFWPALISCAALAVYQLHPRRRHATDFTLVAVSIVLGLIIDTLWVQLGFMDFTDKRPLSSLAPGWIMILWVGFALTINHSLVWLRIHPLLPAIAGAVCAPLTYLAGLKLGAVVYTAETSIVSTALGLAWAIALTILVKLSQRDENTSKGQALA